MDMDIELRDTAAKLDSFFKQMLELSREELEMIEQGCFKVLEGLNLRRNSLKKEIENCIESMKKCEEIESNRSAETTTFLDRKEIYAGYIEQKAEIRDIIVLIQANDSKSRALLSERMRETKVKLGNARTNKKAFHVYNPDPIFTDAWFFDKRK